MALSGLVPVISTGMASLSEIETAVNILSAHSPHKPYLLHCVSQYPAPPEEMNLNRISTLQSLFHSNLGISDHTSDNLASVLAVSLGAIWVEKHFTLDRSLPGPDHFFSITPEQLASLKTQICLVNTLLGVSYFQPTANEQQSSRMYKLSLCYSRDLSPGTIITESHITFLRPGSGLPPSSLEYIVGLSLAKSVKSSSIIKLSDFIPNDQY